MALHMPPDSPKHRSAYSHTIAWLEGYANTDLRYIMHGGFWLSVGNVAASLTAFVSSVAFAYLVPQHTFGVYQYVLAMFGLLAVITLPKVNEAMLRAVARGFEGEFMKTVQVRMRWGVLAGLAGLAVAIYYFARGNTQLGSAFLIVAAFVPFCDPLGTFSDYLKARRLFREASIIKVVTRIFVLVAMLSVIYVTQELVYIVIAYFILYALVRIVPHFVTLRLYPPNTLADEDTIRYGKSLSLLSVFRAGIAQLDKILVFQYLGAVELAMYFFATAPVGHIQNALAALADLAFPKFSENDAEATKRALMRKILRLTLLVLVPVVAIYILLVPHVFTIAFPGYGDAIPLTQMFALSLLFFPSMLLSTALVAHKRERALWVSRTIAPFIRLAILIPSVHFFGLEGMVLGVVAVSAADFVMNYIALYWPTKPVRVL